MTSVTWAVSIAKLWFGATLSHDVIIFYTLCWSIHLRGWGKDNGAAHPGNIRISWQHQTLWFFFSRRYFLFSNKSNDKTLQVLKQTLNTIIVLFYLCNASIAGCPHIYLLLSSLSLALLFFFFSCLQPWQLTDQRCLWVPCRSERWLTFGGFYGTAIACSTLAVWLPVISSWHPSSAWFIWLPHASKEYFTLKIFLNFYIPLICNEQYIQYKTLGWNACRRSHINPAAANLRNIVSSYAE